jgi:ankyrin repeat protein
LLLSRTPRANVNLTDAYGRTPLVLACDLQRTAFVSFLLSNGARVDATTEENATSLHWCDRMLLCGRIDD